MKDRIKFSSKEDFAKAMIDNVLEDEYGCKYFFDMEEKGFIYINKSGNSNALSSRWKGWETHTFTIVKKSRFPDKALVWCWNNNFEVRLRFWDAKNDCTFQFDGTRDGYSYDNYELFTGTPPKHMEEMKSKLEE